MRTAANYFSIACLLLFGLSRCVPEQTRLDIIEVEQPEIKLRVNPQYGQTLEAKAQEAPEGWSRQIKWYRDDDEIVGANALSYKLGDADISHHIRISIRFTHKELGLKTDEAFSLGSDAVDWQGGTPEILGLDAVPRVGSKLESKGNNALKGWTPKLRWYLIDPVQSDDNKK